ncbi:type I-F CRISPR-associated endoribonuclease Cas6/Csy4 [Psychrobium sp. nBUS_13]|uniref:type I-F CRISPR-associated endoribonuclease Cas6/Csy4 n=1 Tax=Psychrobium sp. nBUS_13 TaxID=3395319 RepID=UPI003EBEA950
MEYYIDIKLLPDAEMRLNVLLDKVYTKFHKALFDLKATDLGVSFPEVKVLLGSKIRIHGSAEKLNELMNIQWIGGLIGYCQCTEILEIPSDVKYRNISRWQSNMSESHLRRLKKRGTIKDDEVKAYKAKMFAAQMTTLPYVELDSVSNGKHHRRYIETGDIQDSSTSGNFDFFGLSKTATIPWF